ncbi:MAG: hypothetical protein WBC51_25170 [Vicinamibacterales bacterium]
MIERVQKGFRKGSEGVQKGSKGSKVQKVQKRFGEMNYALTVLAVGILQTVEGDVLPSRRACELLTAAEIQSVQAATVKEVKPSNGQSKGLHYLQCVYATTDFAHSVSVTLITAPSRGTVKTYWTDTFEKSQERREKKASRARESEEEEGRRILGLGNEAFWTGDARAGAIYVFSGDAILRISAGGVAEEPERIRRSQQLATIALRRLSASRD